MRSHVLSLAVTLVSLSMPAIVIAAPVCPPEVKEARELVNEAEAACKDADNARAASNARAAIELLKYL